MICIEMTASDMSYVCTCDLGITVQRDLLLTTCTFRYYCPVLKLCAIPSIGFNGSFAENEILCQISHGERHCLFPLLQYGYFMLNKNTLGVKKVRGQSEAACKQADATKSFDIS